MGNGVDVTLAYMGIRVGEPWPTIAMKVGVGRERREEGVISKERLRMYSWQFWGEWY